MKRWSTSVQFDDELERLPEQNWRHKRTAHKQSTLTQEEHTNATAWQIDNLESLLAEIKNDLKEVLSMILNIQSIYTKYLDQSNEIDKECNKICILEKSMRG